jgi:hypothetical protein
MYLFGRHPAPLSIELGSTQHVIAPAYPGDPVITGSGYWITRIRGQ